MVFSLDEKTDVGSDRCTSVSDDYRTADSDFNGRINWIQIDLGDDAQDADHLITPEVRISLKWATQFTSNGPLSSRFWAAPWTAPDGRRVVASPM